MPPPADREPSRTSRVFGHEPISVVLALKDLPKSVEEDLDSRSLIRLKVPSAEAQADVWRHHLKVAAPDVPPNDDAIRETVARHPLAPGAIRRAAVAATARDGDALGIDALLWAAQLQTQTGLAGIAERVVTSFTWDDLVLPEETLDSLDSVLIHYR